MRAETDCVRFDPAPGNHCRPTVPPIYQTATFRQRSAVVCGEFDYSRSGNPTRKILEEHAARLEGAERGVAFNSGMAALAATASLLESGEHLWAGVDLYGGTYRLLTRVLARQGVGVRFIDTTDLDALSREPGPVPRLVLVETPSNPKLQITDIEALAGLVHERGGLLAVDNSLMSPYLQQPLRWGADIVIHSATKYLSGHSDVTAGAVMTRDSDLADAIAYYQNAAGTGLAPFDAWLLLRGMKTLAVRLSHQQSSAARLARFLSEHPRVRRVYYPGLDTHARAEIHRRQASGPGAIVCFETGSVEFSRRLVEAARLFDITVSFGGVGSSMSLPAFMSHASIPATVRSARHIPEDLVRISAGIEHPDDLVEDLEHAIEAAETATVKGERPWRHSVCPTERS